MTPRRIVISGCSGGGKSTLLAELAARGLATRLEPGREIVREELAAGGDALPWVNLEAFLRRAAARSLADVLAAAELDSPVFFDRSIVDALAGLERLGAPVEPAWRDAAAHYDDPVFMAPPWPDLFETDPERRHAFEDAVAEHESLIAAYAALGYRLVDLPKLSVAQRADFVLETFGRNPP